MYHVSPQLRSNMSQRNRLRPRKLYGQAEWIYVLGGETNPGRCTVNTVEKYNPASDTWCEVSPMMTPCRGLGAAILEGILYVMGGSDGIAALNRVGSLVSGMYSSFGCATVHSNFSLDLHFLSHTLMTASLLSLFPYLHTYPVSTSPEKPSTYSLHVLSLCLGAVLGEYQHRVFTCRPPS